MTPVVHFLTGLPRSGTALLANILAQNPLLAPSGPSGMGHLVATVQQSWQQSVALRAQGDAAVPRVASALRGLVYGFYEAELGAGRVVFDRGPNWLGQIELMEQVLKRPVRIVVTIRDVRAVLGSLERAYRQSPVERRMLSMSPQNPTGAVTVYERVESMLARTGSVGFAAAALQDVIDRGMQDRLLIVPYDALTRYPDRILAELHMGLGLPPFKYDVENVQPVLGDEGIRPVVAPAPETWPSVLPGSLAKRVETGYAGLNQMAMVREPAAPAPSPTSPGRPPRKASRRGAQGAQPRPAPEG